MSTAPVPTTDDIEFFFAAPEVDHERWLAGNENRSVLALLRQECLDSLVGLGSRWPSETSVANRPDRYRRLYASAFVILAGVDLLGKFLAGDDASGKVASRFKEFTKRYMDMSPDEAEALYSVRNSLMHSFGLYDSRNQRGLALQQGCDRLDPQSPPVWLINEVWFLCVEHLYKAFLRSIERYRVAVQGTPELQQRFSKMYPDYGYTPVWRVLIPYIRQDSGSEP